ncbi:ccr4-not transcription complex subunit 2 [Anaeramoeba flamelloides]|uniref:Ccr4-not transcription complex subunit 2 n=1 Tax=Anaeramoeba flamelloides TaxID=1746091 RepID=A0ABQ8ZAK2_9EUKA|nr:ccr4-not transcription complex subunit 2 [Anaeramoeba flamelloides]
MHYLFGDTQTNTSTKTNTKTRRNKKGKQQNENLTKGQHQKKTRNSVKSPKRSINSPNKRNTNKTNIKQTKKKKSPKKQNSKLNKNNTKPSPKQKKKSVVRSSDLNSETKQQKKKQQKKRKEKKKDYKEILNQSQFSNSRKSISPNRKKNTKYHIDNEEFPALGGKTKSNKTIKHKNISPKQNEMKTKIGNNNTRGKKSTKKDIQIDFDQSSQVSPQKYQNSYQEKESELNQFSLNQNNNNNNNYGFFNDDNNNYYKANNNNFKNNNTTDQDQFFMNLLQKKPTNNEPQTLNKSSNTKTRIDHQNDFKNINKHTKTNEISPPLDPYLLKEQQQIETDQNLKFNQDRYYNNNNNFKNKEEKYNDEEEEESEEMKESFLLSGLIKIIKMTDVSLNTLMFGVDLQSLGLDLNTSDPLYLKFTSPWKSKLNQEKKEYEIPEYYNLTPPPVLTLEQINRFSDTLLLYMFYSSPRDALQLVATQNLIQRGWAYHKKLHVWLRPDIQTDRNDNNQIENSSSYLIFNPKKWEIIKQANFVLNQEDIL